MVAISSIIAAVVQVVVSVALSFIAKALRKKPKADTDSLDFEQTVQRRLRNGQPLEILVGRRIAAGVGVFDDAYGTKNEHGVSITVLSAKPCTQFHQMFVDGEPVTLNGDPTTGERSVTSHFLGKNDVPRVKVRIFLGDNNSDVSTVLAAKFDTKFDSNDDGGQYCILITDCRNTNDDFDEESGENFIPFQGYPEFKVELSGVKICDPRVPGSDYADEATYVFSDNAALIDAQFDFGWYDGVGAGRALIVGNGYPLGLMDIDKIKSNADFCDAENFACNGIIRSGTGDQEEIWKCFNADRVEHPANIYSVPEGHRVVSETIDLGLYPGVHISEYDEDGYSTEVFNEVQTVYAEPEEFYGEKDLPIYANAAWVAADNHIPRQMSLPLLFVTNKVQAGKLEKQEIYISRMPATCTIADLPFGFIRIGVGDIITVVNSLVSGINNRQWIVKGKGQSPQGDVSLMLRAYAGTDAFDFDELTETPEPNIQVPVPRPWPWWERVPYVNPGTVSSIGTNVSGIISGTTELTEVNITGRGALTTELNTFGSGISGLNTNVSGIISGTTPLSEVTIVGRGALTTELNTFGVDISGLSTNVSGIISGTTALTEVTISGRGALTSELNTIGTDILDIGTNQTGIIAGTLPLTDVTLSGIGSLINKDAAQDANIQSAASGGASLSVTASPVFLYGFSIQVGQVTTTNATTLTVNNGSGSETVSYIKVSGDTVTVDNQAAMSTTFSAAPGINGKNAVYKAVVTDGADTAEVQISIWIEYDDGNGI